MTESTSALDFKSATLYAIRAVLNSEDLTALTTDLNRRMQEAGSFFAGEPFVIDASAIEGPIDWEALLEAFSAHKLPVIGFIAPEAFSQEALDAGLARVELTHNTSRTTTQAQAAAEVAEPVQAAIPLPSANAAQAQTIQTTPMVQPTAATSANFPTQVVQGPLRSGQRVYARGADLIVMGVVSQGAEVIADGNIHIYGPLRGKAMAGARGDAQARIYTTSLDAELVAVAGVYRVIEGPLSAEIKRKPAMVYLKEQTLRMDPLQD